MTVVADSLRIADIFKEIAEPLVQVEAKIRGLAGTSDPLLSQAVSHLLRAGGKRIRPALLILSGLTAGGRDTDPLVYLAAAVEVLHMATLVHDDVVDESTLRRGVSTLNSLWDNKVSVIAGDYLYATASKRIIEFGVPRISLIFAQAVKNMCIGEIEQLTGVGALPTLEAYLSRIQKKTAGLMEACAQVGGIAVGAQETVEQALAEYGLSLGIAFQIKDDILDWTGTQEAIGKPAVHDFTQNNLTAPLLFSLEEEPFRHAFQEMQQREDGQAQRAEQIARLVQNSQGVPRAEALCREYTERAQQALASLPSSSAKNTLLALADFVTDRQS